MADTFQKLALLPEDAYALTATDVARFNEEQARGMVPPSARLLSEVAQMVEPHTLQDKHIVQAIERLFEAADGQRYSTKQKRAKRTLVGLAAPQIGEPYRIVLIDTKVSESRRHYGKLECFINPEIIWRTRETVEGREGCFSAGPVWGLVRRPVAVKIRAVTPDGQPTERIFEGFTARIACHEVDHLDGIRFPERIRSEHKRHWVHTEELSEYPARIRHWPRLCSMERWEAFKTGKIVT